MKEEKVNKNWKIISQQIYESRCKRLEGSCITTGRYQKTDIKNRGGTKDKTFPGDSGGKAHSL